MNRDTWDEGKSSTETLPWALEVVLVTGYGFDPQLVRERELRARERVKPAESKPARTAGEGE